MMDSIRHFKTPYDTMGDLFDAIPSEDVCKVCFEDMLFETWNHGRTVLIGGALPSTGVGAIVAMQDAVILANYLNDIKPISFENIKAALNGYKEERFDAVKGQHSQTYFTAKLQFGHIKQLTKDNANRPQTSFLPRMYGAGYVLPQKPSKRIQKEKEEEKAKKKAAAAATLEKRHE
ncbi:hypothetical protein BGZ47_003212 [Haplosporangium gracile]|nr:hypothetical protein BGZ47_003212 [Haplosporangium gracile]